MDVAEVINTQPLQVQRSLTPIEVLAITSAKAGVIVPLKAIHLLREDAVQRGEVRVAVDMAETAETLLNPVQLTVFAHFIPYLAFPKFGGSLHELNASYKKVALAGRPVVPFFNTVPFARANPIFNKLGLHAKEGVAVRDDVIEAYNVLVNFRRESRSTKIALRQLNDTTLAEGFWNTPRTHEIVPDFDQSMMDGEVELQIAASRLPVSGLGVDGTSYLGASANLTGFRGTTGGVSPAKGWTNNSSGALEAGKAKYMLGEDPGKVGYPAVFAELAGQGVKLSLANIDLAKKTQAFARLRQTYAGLDDDHIIDMLMDGLRVPEEMMKQPMLLARQSTIFGYEKRWATDSANLDKAVTNGRTAVQLRFRTPPMNTGGIILITAEVVPQLLYERMADPNLFVTDPDLLPAYVRDVLDPEPVEVVLNKAVDVEHGDPDSVFGYAPLNAAWRRSMMNIGGKFYKAKADVETEDRMRFWAADPTDPTLTEDYYLVKDLPHTVFEDTVSDPFEFVTTGGVVKSGLTVYGPPLSEDVGAYDEVMSQVDTGRIDQTPVAAAVEGGAE